MDELEWGRDLSRKGEYTDSWTCPVYDCDRSKCGSEYSENKYVSKIAMGVRIDPRKKREGRPYIVLCECGGCFKDFWFHITEDFAKELLKMKEVGQNEP